MGIDEAGEGDPVTAVDFFHTRRGKIGTDGDEHTVAHVDVTAGYITQFRIHGQHVSVSHDELAARRELTCRTTCRAQSRCLR